MRMRIPCAAFAALCLLAPAPAPALASTHPFLEVAAAGTPACGVAVDGAGNRYVSDYHGDGAGFVALFNANNEYLTKIPSQASENAACDLAVDSAGRLYANYLHQAVVRLAPSSATIDPERATGIALDAADRLYVTHRTHVSVYDPDGAPVLDEGTPLWIGLGALTDAYGVAVSSAGHVYVADAADNTVEVFDPAAPLNPIQTIDGAGTPAGGFTDLTDTDLAISPTSGNLLVVDNLQPGYAHPLAVVDEFDPTGAYVGQISHWSVAAPGKTTAFSLIHGQPSGLAVDAAGNIYVTSGNEEGSLLYEFGPAPLSTARVAVARAGTGAGTVVSQIGGVGNGAFTGIDCGLLCATEYELGATITLRATPRPHSTFAAWSVPGNPNCAKDPSCRFQPFSATEVTATFTAIPQKTLTVSRGGAGAGTVTSSPVGLECGPTCTQGFDQGTKVTLTAAASPGSEFTGWAGACSGIGDCPLTLGADAALTANFQPLERPAPIDRGSRTISANFTAGPPVQLGALEFNGARAILAVTVPGPGILSAAAKQLRPAKLSAKRAGTLSLLLALNKAGKRALARQGKLAVRVKIAFEPSGGGDPVLLTKTVNFKSPSRR